MLLFKMLLQESPVTVKQPTKNAYILLCWLIAVGCTYSAHGQQAPCQGEAYRQFDFWVGEWEVYHPTADTIVGTNHIKSILNSCVIEENWRSSSGWQGKSFNTYNPLDSTWNQVWVDQSGSTYHFSGRYSDHVMLMRGETISRQSGKKVLFEMSYTHDPETDTVRQVWKASSDEGTSWNPIFDGIYKKKKTP